MTDLLDAAAAVAAEDPFAEARAENPGAKLIRILDRRLDVEFILAVQPGEEWHALLPPEQTCEIALAATAN